MSCEKKKSRREFLYEAVGFAAVAAAFLFTTNCGPEPGTRQDVTITDSAGVEIVLNHSPRWPVGTGWRLSEEPLVGTVGIGDPDYEFHMVHGARKLGDGRLAVAAGGAMEIRLYDAEGLYLSTLGRRGEGPGEFTALTRIWVLQGDSILAFDRRLRRISVFDPSGGFVRSFGFTSLEGVPVFPSPVGTTPGGKLVVLERAIAEDMPGTGFYVDSTYVFSFDMEGNFLDTLDFAPDREAYANFGNGRLWTSRAPFGRASSWAIFGEGYFFGSGHSFEIEYSDGDGTQQRLIRWDRENPDVTSQDVELYKEGLMPTRGSPAIQNWTRAVTEDMTFPRTMPAYSSLLADPEGNLWVGEFPRPGSTVRTWQAFNPEGVLLGPVEMPAALRVYEIGSDYVLGQWIDEMNIQSFRLYRLIKGS